MSSSSPILNPNTAVRCSAIQHRKIHRDDTSRFQRFHPKYALDTDPNTYWAGGYNGSQECWLEVLLPDDHVVTHIEVSFRYAAEVVLQAFIDGIWITAKNMKAPSCPKEKTVSLSVSTFVRPARRLRLAETKRHPSEVKGTNTNYNLYNCGMEVDSFQLYGYPATPISADPDELPAVFFSYCWSNQELVTQLAFETENAIGFKVWQDIGQMGGGDSLLMEIMNGISNAKVLVSCMSKYYAKSINCQKEICMAIEFKLPVVLILFDEADLEYLKSENPFLAQAFAKHTNPIKVVKVNEDTLNSLMEALEPILSEERMGEGNALPLAKTTVPAHAVVNFNEVSSKHSVKVTAISHEDSVIELDQASSRHDLALGRPCDSSGNFYTQLHEWREMHDSCVTVGLREGQDSRRISGRWSGAKDGEGGCWISVDLGCLALVDEVEIDFEAAYASVYRVMYEKGEPLQLYDDGTFGGEWEKIGDFYGGEGTHTTEKFNPVLTRSIRIELVEPRWSGAGFSLWSLSVFGTSEQEPIYSYFFSCASEDLNTWYKFKIINDVESRMRKKAYKHVGKAGLPNNCMHEDPLIDRDNAMEQCEAVIVMYSKASASDEWNNHVINDVRDAMQLKKPIIPIVLDGLTFKKEGDGDKLRWPPTVPTLRAAFEQLIFVDFSNPDQYSLSLGLLIRTLLG